MFVLDFCDWYINDLKYGTPGSQGYIGCEVDIPMPLGNILREPIKSPDSNIFFSSPWSVISLYVLGCNIVLQLGDLVKVVNRGL